MKRKTHLQKIFISLITIVLISSCTKTINEAELVKTANFKVSSKTIYLDQTDTLEATDLLGNKSYEWDFGDGTTLKDASKVSHQYITAGTHTAKLKINGYEFSQEIRVLPGRISYQIENKSISYLNILVYLDNYETGCTKRLDINWKYKTDTIYANTSQSNHFTMKNSHIFGISIFINNSEYTFPDIKWIDDFNHHVITLTDSTRLSPRSGHGFPFPVYYLKDLYN
ncbi:MAG: PKD domain-containing protein [Paludibacter sp.]|jgi:PKD domain